MKKDTTKAGLQARIEKLEEEKAQLAETIVKLKEENKGIPKFKIEEAFLSNISHSIRTPMNAIVGFSNLLSYNTLTARQRREYISYVNTSSDILLKFVDDFLEVIKIKSGQIEFKPSETNLNGMLYELYIYFNP